MAGSLIPDPPPDPEHYQPKSGGLLTRLSQLASGNRLVNASVDAAGLAISEGLRSDIAALSQSVRNIETGGNFIRVAEGDCRQFPI